MTNNDEAIDALNNLRLWRREKQSTHKTMIGVTLTEDAVLDAVEQALTPQSSADLGRVREALEFYADTYNYNQNCAPVEPIKAEIDGGKKAREALRILDEVIGRAE